MGASIVNEGELRVLRLTGMLRKAELDAIQWGEAVQLAPGKRMNVLVLAEEFVGWHRDDRWDDVSFVSTYGDRIAKIALVAEPQWEARLLMFTGAGVRSTQIKFFPAGQL